MPTTNEARVSIEVKMHDGKFEIERAFKGNEKSLLIGISATIKDMIEDLEEDAGEQVKILEFMTNEIKRNIALMFIEDSIQSIAKIINED